MGELFSTVRPHRFRFVSFRFVSQSITSQCGLLYNAKHTHKVNGTPIRATFFMILNCQRGTDKIKEGREPGREVSTFF